MSNSDPGAANQKPGILQRVKKYFMGDSGADKKKLASLGSAAFLAYGVVSNLTYGACLTFAWITMVKVTGYSPIMPGQWKTFLGFYAGLWAIQNFLRPVRIPLAIAMAPPFEHAMVTLSEHLRVPRGVAFGIMLGAVAVSTITVLGSALFLLGGFPPTPPELLAK